MATRLFPTNIQHIGDELAVAWNDGTESFLKLELMRPDVQYTANSFLLRGYEIVGGYALQPTWGDGHGSGIYAYPFLKRLADAA